MRFNLEFEDLRPPEDNEFLDWFRPRGATVADGVRLAIINTIFLVLLLIAVAVGSLFLRLVTWALPFPVIFPAFFVLVICLLFGLFFWYRYAQAHGSAALARGREVRPDVFGAIGAIPFIGIALLLISSGILAFFIAVITFSGGRTVDALARMLYGVIFTAAAAANIIIARAASD